MRTGPLQFQDKLCVHLAETSVCVCVCVRARPPRRQCGLESGRVCFCWELLRFCLHAAHVHAHTAL